MLVVRIHQPAAQRPVDLTSGGVLLGAHLLREGAPGLVFVGGCGEGHRRGVDEERVLRVAAVADRRRRRHMLLWSRRARIPAAGAHRRRAAQDGLFPRLHLHLPVPARTHAVHRAHGEAEVLDLVRLPVQDLADVAGLPDELLPAQAEADLCGALGNLVLAGPVLQLLSVVSQAALMAVEAAVDLAKSAGVLAELALHRRRELLQARAHVVHVALHARDAAQVVRLGYSILHILLQQVRGLPDAQLGVQRRLLQDADLAGELRPQLRDVLRHAVSEAACAINLPLQGVDHVLGEVAEHHGLLRAAPRASHVRK
mmetsp:Transcript_4900/g.13666  ORF Transcript_4900/g.13666 Transcript_4900/m.13666 type:complete len:313 (+) Transcript_4900:366-1304(+)